MKGRSIRHRPLPGLFLGIIGYCLGMVLLFGGEGLSRGGLVSGIVSTENELYSISPVGIIRGVGEEATLVHKTSVRFFAIGRDSGGGKGAQLLLSGGEPGVSGMIGFYSLEEQALTVERVADDLAYDLSYEPTRRLLAVACADGRVLVGQLDLGGAVVGEFEVRHQHTAPVRSVTFSPDGRFLASAALDGLVFVSDLDGTSKPVVLQDHSDKVECVIFSADSTEVISGARDGRVRVHSVEGRLIRNYSQLGGLQSGTPWQRKNQVLSLAVSTSPAAIVVGTSLGYVLRLSLRDTSSTVVDQMPGPINALAIGESLFVGSNQVAGIAWDQVMGSDQD